jgi:formylglycine-generating enzyme required for sulfatase activity
VNYDDACAYAKWLTERERQAGRLPGGAERGNDWHLFGVGGNVWECTSERPGGGFDAWRGASCYHGNQVFLRCVYRSDLATIRGSYDGFRLVLSR